MYESGVYAFVLLIFYFKFLIQENNYTQVTREKIHIEPVGGEPPDIVKLPVIKGLHRMKKKKKTT